MHICFLNFVFPDSKHHESQVEENQGDRVGGEGVYLRLAYRNATFKFTAELKHPSFVTSEALRTQLTECISYPVFLTTSHAPIITSKCSNNKIPQTHTFPNSQH